MLLFKCLLPSRAGGTGTNSWCIFKAGEGGNGPHVYAVYVDNKNIVWASKWSNNATLRQILGRPGEVWLPESISLHTSFLLLNTTVWTCLYWKCGWAINLKEPLHNSLRSVISRTRAVCFVVFLANSRAVGCKKTPCRPSRTDYHSLARVMQRLLNRLPKAHENG